MHRRFLLGVLAAATAGIGAGVLAPIAADAAVFCGQTITTSMTLTTDLTCPGSGVFINGDNVVLDLGGHTITGPAPSGGGTGSVRGVSVRPNHTGDAVRNGTIRGFDSGVDITSGVSNVAVSGLTLDANGLGIRSDVTTSGAVITGNTISNTTQFSAMQLGGTGHLVEDNTMSNGASGGVFTAGSQLLIRSNRFNDMGASAVVVGAFPSTPGPFVGNQIVGNLIAGSGRVFNSSAVSITNGSNTAVDGNSITGRRATPGVFVNNSAGTVVSNNSLDSNSTGVLVRGTSSGTQVVTNRITRSTFAGIAVESEPTGTLVSGNVAYANGSNGIDVRSPSTTITGNTAVGNGGLGIFAVAGVTDGGGNSASGNGNPAQCSPTIAC